jgi:hypothetical protein
MSDLIARCRCGQTAVRAIGRPIASAACYCSDCRRAGHDLEKLPEASALVQSDGGTAVVLFRKDRVIIEKGEDLLRAYRLVPESPTRRIVASCCNTAMFGDFTRGFWISIYRDRVAGDVPPLEMRTMTRERPGGVILSDDVPNYAGYSGKFMVRLIAAWLAMGFRNPRLPDYPPLAERA